MLTTNRDPLAWLKPFGVLDRQLGDVDAELLVRIGRLQAQVETAVAVRRDPEERPLTTISRLSNRSVAARGSSAWSCVMVTP